MHSFHMNRACNSKLNEPAHLFLSIRRREHLSLLPRNDYTLDSHTTTTTTRNKPVLSQGSSMTIQKSNTLQQFVTRPTLLCTRLLSLLQVVHRYATLVESL